MKKIPRKYLESIDAVSDNCILEFVAWTIAIHNLSIQLYRLSVLTIPSVLHQLHGGLHSPLGNT